MTMNGKLIVITGLDGSGTTSIAEAMCKTDPRGRLLHTPNDPYICGREKIDGVVRLTSQAAHYFYYLSACIYASACIEKLLINHNVYCVRYLLDTVVSHRVAGLDVNLNYKTDLYSILEPDLTIFVTADELKRQSRISARGKNQLDELLDYPEIRSAFQQEFQRFQNHFITIDNSADGIMVAAQQAIDVVKRILV